MLMEMGIIALSVIAAWSIAFMALRYAFKPKDDKPEIPYWFRNGMEDATAINIDTLMAIRDFLMILENRINDERLLLGQIRTGEYDKDQRAAPRQPQNKDRAS